MTENLPTISELFVRIARGRADLEAWSVTLSEAELNAPRKDGWSIKDHLVHLAMWELSTAALLRGESRYARMGIQPGEPIPDETALNAQIQSQYKNRSVEDALNLFHSAHMELLGELAKLSDADLQKPYSHFQPNDKDADDKNPILGWIIGNSYGHYEEHIPWIRTMLES
jgi:hypothetical protein